MKREHYIITGSRFHVLKKYGRINLQTASPEVIEELLLNPNFPYLKLSEEGKRASVFSIKELKPLIEQARTEQEALHYGSLSDTSTVAKLVADRVAYLRDLE